MPPLAARLLAPQLGTDPADRQDAVPVHRIGAFGPAGPEQGAPTRRPKPAGDPDEKPCPPSQAATAASGGPPAGVRRASQVSSPKSSSLSVARAMSSSACVM